MISALARFFIGTDATKSLSSLPYQTCRYRIGTDPLLRSYAQ